MNSASRAFDTTLLWNAQVRHNAFKRCFDIIFSLCTLLFGTPLFLIIAIAVWITSPGPAVFSQERVGRGGRLFRCYKFRTMHVDADERLQQLLATHPEMRAEWEHRQKLQYDTRVTRIGAFLRRSSLDELPQFWNVLKGDLSVVGPRPLLLDEVRERLNHKAAKILSVRPGLTGLWQVSGRSNTSYEKRIELDEEYIERYSFWLDLKLIAKTIPAMIFSKGAY
jgi:undecaprenyl-phosphate galactose phosphotransferase